MFFMIIILTSCLGFYACGPKEEFHYVPAQYYPVYKEGDTLIYGNGNKYDSFICKSKTIDEYKYDILNHFQFISYCILSKNHLELNQPCGCNVDLDFSGLQLDWLNCSQEFGYDQTPDLQSMVVNNVTYTNVYELDNYAQNTTPNYYVKKLYFNYKYWVIRYIKADSTTWDLVHH